MQLQRRKRMVDSAFYFWIFGLANLFIAQLLYSYSLFSGNNLDFVIGIVFFVGFAMSVINGMLYKIVPFLVWLHLHRKLAFDTQNRSKIPNMNDVISGKKSRLQLLMHVTSLGLLLLSVIKPDPLIYLAAIIWLINSVTLWVYLVQSIMLYKSCLTSK